MKFKFIIILSLSFLFTSESQNSGNASNHPWSTYYNSNGSLGKLGEWGFPSNPMNDRAVGYLFKGKAKTAVTNYVEFIVISDCFISLIIFSCDTMFVI